MARPAAHGLRDSPYAVMNVGLAYARAALAVIRLQALKRKLIDVPAEPGDLT
jgi:hypothetical protein